MAHAVDDRRGAVSFLLWRCKTVRNTFSLKNAEKRMLKKEKLKNNAEKQLLEKKMNVEHKMVKNKCSKTNA